jgi:hypothetical protein
LADQHKKLKNEIDNLSESLKSLKTTGNDKGFLDLARGYKSDRNRIHDEILHKYGDLFAVIQSARKLSVLGIQHVDLLVRKNEVEFRDRINRYNAMGSLMIKYIEVFDEIVCLIENGFPDGAMQRWRTFLEYSIIILFILEQGEETAEAYINNFYKAIEDDLRPRTNFAWTKAAAYLREEKPISITKLLDHINGIDTDVKKWYIALYKITSQSIHGSSVGVNLSFNDYISFDMNESHPKNADYYAGGVSTVITNTMSLLFDTFKVFFNTFLDEEMNLNQLWKDLFKEYVKVYYRFYPPISKV